MAAHYTPQVTRTLQKLAGLNRGDSRHRQLRGEQGLIVTVRLKYLTMNIGTASLYIGFYVQYCTPWKNGAKVPKIYGT